MERFIGVFKKFNIGLVVVALLLASCAPLVFIGNAVAAEHDAVVTAGQATDGTIVEPQMGDSAKVRCWAFVAAALATGLGSIAAGYAVSNVGTAAMGAVAEKPELMGKSLIYVALAEGIAIYGLLIAIIVLAKV
ncbi:MAG: H+transporting two-sector ATPase C subunit [Lentisphaerae bacterium]|nr:H+transporting two-sector ATPase C subunit [Lentisphaerota bacterium]